jgi:hypothetical protein
MVMVSLPHTRAKRKTKAMLMAFSLRKGKAKASTRAA